MNKTMKKALSLVLMIIMVLSSVPMTSFAASCPSNWYGHSWGDYTVTTPATCRTKGEKTRYCKHCGGADKAEVAVDPTAHSKKAVAFQDSNCTEYGNKAGEICALCGITITGNEIIAPKGHKSVELKAKDPTCTEPGNEAGTKCETCGEILSAKIIPKLNHNYTLLEQSAANCVTGQSGVRKDVCLNCGDIKTSEVKAQHSFGIWRTTTEPTCERAGVKTRKCTVTGCSGQETLPVDKLNHVEETVAAKEPTCTEPGITAGKKCKLCGTKIQGAVEIDARGHNYITVDGVAPTCEAAGYSDSIYCSVCGDIKKKSEPINATGHALEYTTTAATCTTTGLKLGKCKNKGCNYETREVLPITHESNNWVKFSDATCTTDGLEKGYCKYCGKYSERITPALGHDIEDRDWSTTRYPDCTKTGVKTATCHRCKKQITEEVPALGHNPVTKTAAVAPTCTKEGATESKACSRCGTVTTASEKIDKIAHKYGEWTVKTAATCALPGVKEATCKECSYKATESIPKTDHVKEEIPAVAATCTTAGSTVGNKCKNCGVVIDAPATIEALGHDYSEEKEYIAPTCTEPGKDKGKCSRCGVTKDDVIPATGHTEEVIPGAAATCEESGIKEGKKCITCNQVLVEVEPIPALGHDLVLDTSKSIPATCTEKGYSYSKCSRCNEVEEKIVDVIDHTWGEWQVTTPATCEAQGEETRVCSACNTIEPRSIASLGGHIVATLPGEEATCKAPGKTAGSYCERCNTIFEAQTEIQQLPHTLGDQREVIKKATIAEDGEYGYRCAVCEESVDVTKIAKIDEASIKLSATKYYYNGKTRTPSLTILDAEGNPLEKGTDFEVIYDTGRKNPGKYNVQVTLSGNYEGEFNLSFSINPVKTAKVSYENKGDHILITWDKVAGATGYTVYIYKDSENGTTRKAVKTLTGTSLKLTKDYNGKALQLDENYRIGVVSRTRTEDDTILKSKEAAIKTVTRKLQKPTLTVTTASGKANLKWTNVANETGYEVVYSTSKDGTYKKLTTTKANVVTFSKAFTKGSTVYFKVRAYKTVSGETFYSNYSSVKSIKIK